MSQQSYTVKELADLSGVSVRTLHYYDEIGLLVPDRDRSGYRVYGQEQVAKLQSILAMRACALPLNEIKVLLSSADFDGKRALMAHLQRLQAQRNDIDEAMRRTRNALSLMKGMETMNDAEKFEELKKQSIETFEATYGEEARELYGNEAIDGANEKFLAMSEDAWNAKELLEKTIIAQIKVAKATKDPTSTAAQELAEMHAAWIQMHWADGTYSVEAHKALAQGYLADDRFMAYYDSAAGERATEFLVKALLANL